MESLEAAEFSGILTLFEHLRVRIGTLGVLIWVCLRVRFLWGFGVLSLLFLWWSEFVGSGILGFFLGFWVAKDVFFEPGIGVSYSPIP